MSKQRENWSSRLGFVMAAAGSAIGLGTLWKFPYVTGENGGGAFFTVYVIATILIGLPVFIAELIIGRTSERGAVLSFATIESHSSWWKIAGWMGVASSFLIMSYYSVLAGWGMNYAFMSLQQFWIGKSPVEIEQTFDILAQSGDITLFWHAVFTLITVYVVYHGIRNGIEYWSTIMTSSLLVLLLCLFSYNLTLEGFSPAFDFVLAFDTAKLKASSILEALGLAFFTLSLGQGIMITYGSYMNKDEDIPKTAAIISSMVILVSVLCALSIFPIVFTANRPPQGGFGLVFKTMPLLFSSLKGALIISTLFFLLFVFTALTSAIALVEVVVATLMEIYSIPRKKASIIVGVSCFIFGLPSALANTGLIFPNWQTLYGKNFFETIDSFVSIWLLPLGGFLIALFTGFKIDKERLRQEFSSSSSLGFLFPIWYFFIRYIAPIGVLAIILQQAGVINVDMIFS